MHNPLAASKPKQAHFSPEPVASSSMPSPHEDETLLDSSIDPTNMAPTTLVLAIRKQRRDAKRLSRSEARRSTMRASTLRTEGQMEERERQEKDSANRKGRRAQHETGDVRVVRKMTQDELIAAALEEEERNKEDLRAWVRREEEKRELRRVGRKRVKGPRWTWISRTVGKMVEVLGDSEKEQSRHSGTEAVPLPSGEVHPGKIDPLVTTPTAEIAANLDVESENLSLSSIPFEPSAADVPISDPSPHPPDNTSSSTAGDLYPSDPLEMPIQPVTSSIVQPPKSGSPHPTSTTTPMSPGAKPDSATDRYTRNYFILSQIPGGLPAELGIVLGDHVQWDEVQYVPARNRPISKMIFLPMFSVLTLSDRRPILCPFTGLPAKYRHPGTMIPYATLEGYRQIEALIANRYIWSQSGGCWMGGEEDLAAEGVEEVEGWREAIGGGWLGGQQVSEWAEKSSVKAVTDVGGARDKRRKSDVETSSLHDEDLVLVKKRPVKDKRKSKVNASQ